MVQLFIAGLLLGIGFEVGKHGVRGSYLAVVAAYKKIFKKS
jgi:hypothetical protein